MKTLASLAILVLTISARCLWNSGTGGKGLRPLGQEVATLVNGELEHGTYNVVFSGNQLASGTYFCRLWMSGYESTKRLILPK